MLSFVYLLLMTEFVSRVTAKMGLARFISRRQTLLAPFSVLLEYRLTGKVALCPHISRSLHRCSGPEPNRTCGSTLVVHRCSENQKQRTRERSNALTPDRTLKSLMLNSGQGSTGRETHRHGETERVRGRQMISKQA